MEVFLGVFDYIEVRINFFYVRRGFFLFKKWNM
ncbi:hypothetical protein CLV42_104578 [Chitinophaga ginsengisoli]|uniref:Uncharacterized protein n=1 Tax=Chitinophaga ginsengisoli TaxID=363837 RepID=A0A2P8GEE5_9BACT|nr:hypothetical protein CLV42_104578 [Chitinophaga ginsengisoli]